MNTDFRSDNTLGCSPEVTEALLGASKGSLSPYGKDVFTTRVHRLCEQIFDHEVEVFPVVSGTAGNSIAIAAMTPASGFIFCHEDAHIHREELDAPIFYSGGAELVPIAGADGKLHAADVEAAIAAQPDRRIEGCLSITQATEAGTIYSIDEIGALCEVAARHGLRVHVDGARFANALVSDSMEYTLSLKRGHERSVPHPADLTWRAGVDILTLGATKNGTLGGDIVVVFRPELAEATATAYHRGGHRASKMRLLSSQLEAYFTNELWLHNARRANAMAARLRDALSSIPQITVLRPVEANIVFVRLSKRLAGWLESNGFLFYDWPIFGEDAYRFVTGFNTTSDDVDALAGSIRFAADDV